MKMKMKMTNSWGTLALLVVVLLHNSDEAYLATEAYSSSDQPTTTTEFVSEESTRRTTTDSSTTVKISPETSDRPYAEALVPKANLRTYAPITLAPVTTRIPPTPSSPPPDILTHHSEATCQCFGDVHCITFDSQRISYQGTCRFLMAAPRDSEVIGFEVWGRNFFPSFSTGRRVSYIGEVDVVFGDLVVTFRQLDSSPTGSVQVYINKVKVNLPYLAGGHFIISSSEISARLTTKSGLDVQFSRNWNLKIKLPGHLNSSLTGFCGNFNGIPLDDLTTKDGKFVGDSDDPGAEVGNSYTDTKPDDPSCYKPEKWEEPVCSGSSQQERDEAMLLCNKLIQAESFRKCTEHLKSSPATLNFPETFNLLCLFDAAGTCSNRSAQVAVLSLASICSGAGVPPDPNWRIDLNIPCQCPDPKMTCEPAELSRCPRTCLNPDGGQRPEDCPDALPPTDGECRCPENLVLINNSCVEYESCGCVDADKKAVYDVGSTWLDNTCTTRYTCTNRTITEEKCACKPGHKCLSGFCVVL